MKDEFAYMLEHYLPGYITKNYPEVTEVSVKVVERPATTYYMVALEVSFTGGIRKIKWKELPERVANDWSDHEPENLSSGKVKYKESNGHMEMTLEITEETSCAADDYETEFADTEA